MMGTTNQPLQFSAVATGQPERKRNIVDVTLAPFLESCEQISGVIEGHT